MVHIEQTEFWTETARVPRPSATRHRTREPVFLDATPPLENLFGDVEEALETERLEAVEESAEWVLPEGGAEAERLEEVGEGEALRRDEHSQVVSRRPIYADRPASSFNMARFLTLTGSLDPVEEDGRWLELPRSRFRPRIVLDVVRRISRDYLKDLRSPPRNHSIPRYPRPRGWMDV